MTDISRPRRPSRFRPILDRLERRALMTVDGYLDPTFGTGGIYSAQLNPVGETGLSTVVAVAVEANGSILEAGRAGNDGFDAAASTYGVVHLTASGALDTSFGKGGEADVTLPPGSILDIDGEAGFSIINGPVILLVQPDGKILLGSDFRESNGFNASIIERFDADGTPDASFGTDGRVILDVSSYPGSDVLSTGFGAVSGVAFEYAALQADGRIVLAGFIPNTQSTNGSTAVAVSRLDADGQVDAGFGTNGLVALYDSTPAELTGETYSEENASGLALGPDGRIVVIGSLFRARPASSPQIDSPDIFRLDADGSPDPSFSQAGLLSSYLTVPSPDGVAVLPDGGILAIGFDYSPRGLIGPAVVRLTVDGSIDEQTNLAMPIIDGVPNDYITPDSLRIEPDGDVVMGIANYENLTGGPNRGPSLTVIRLKPDLTPDDSFSSVGVLTIPLSSPAISADGYRDALSFNTANTLAITPSGQIIVGGFVQHTMIGIGAEDPFNYKYNVVVRISPTSTSAYPGDFDGDGIADPAVYIPSLGAFAISDSSRAAVQLIPFGGPGVGTTIPAPGDYTGSGVEEIGAYLPGLGIYAYRPTSGGSDVYVKIGSPGPGLTIPAPGDYYGTGRDDVAVYLADLGAFAVVDPTGKTPGEVVSFGMASVGNAIPAPGDYFGSGKTDFAVYLPTLGEFEIQQPDGTNDYIPFGNPGSLGAGLPMPGDYDGSGVTEMALYLPALGEIAYRPALGGPDVYIPFGGPGVGTVLPMAGDYTGSGKTEPGVYIPALGELGYRPPTGPDVYIKLGIPGAGETVPVTPVVLFASEVIAGSGSGGTVSALSVPNVVVGLETPGSPGSKKAKLGDVVSWETAALV